MPTNKNKKQYDMQYAKDKLKRIPLNVQKEKYEEIKGAANIVGEPVNGYIKKAIDAYPTILNSSVITFILDKDISFSDEIHPFLEKILLDNSDYMLGFTRQGDTTGKYQLILRFKCDCKDNERIAKQFTDILTKFHISYSYASQTTTLN
ncbi:MAG: hypothetical protein HDT30_10615 [Clostridiales bacterium]|nr:hypothetical protein [Clostridiales bacterium]